MKPGWRLALLALAALVAGVAALGIGGAALPLDAVARALVHPRAGGAVGAIVWQLRLPRIVIADIVGATLALAGFLLQGLLRNPLVDPYLTGVSAGTGAAVAIGVTVGVGAALVPVLGFGAGLATALIVAALARRGAGLDVERLILAGISLSAFFSAIVVLVLTRSGPGAAQAIIAWLAGSLDGRGWPDVIATLPYAFVGVALAAVAAPTLNALRLGRTTAGTLGVDLVRAQWLLLAAASLLTSVAVALGGLIGFVGLIVPHLARRIVGSDARVALPAVVLIGGIVMPLADAASRALLAPSEIPLSVLLAFIGVPAFLYLYSRPEARRLWGT
ncbi:MAG: FecCD family ABC transporter permease [Vulcanimicrobiaceae bacterium]